MAISVGMWQWRGLMIAVLCAVTVCSARLSAQGASFTDRVFISPSASAARFDTDLFSIDPSIKQHPTKIVGSAYAVDVGYRHKSISFMAEVFRSRLSGSGNWLNIDDLSAEEAAQLPVATGRTIISIDGMMGIVKKSILEKKTVHPYGEIGAGVGRMNVSFNGTVTAIDPTDGESFTVSASDSVRRRIPVGAVGAGIEARLPTGLLIHAGYRWELGSAVTIGITYFPFRRSAEK